MNSKTQLFFDEVAFKWEDKYDQQKLKRINELFNTYLPQMKAPVLDLGSGTGILLPELHNRLAKDAVIIELDISSKMLHEALEKQPVNGVNYIQGDGHFLPLKNNFFSTVLCFQVFPHFQKKQLVIKELFRVLKVSGRLIILHLMGHKELNEMHHKAGRAVEEDRIVSANKLAEQLNQYQFNTDTVIEKKDLYLIESRKL